MYEFTYILYIVSSKKVKIMKTTIVVEDSKFLRKSREVVSARTEMEWIFSIYVRMIVTTSSGIEPDC